MSFKYVRFLFLSCAFLLLMVACGGGGGSGNTNASLSVVLSSASVAAGKSVNAVVTVSSTSGKTLSNLTPTLVSDSTDVVPSITDTNGTNSSGITNITLSTRNIKSTPTTVRIYAILDGVSSSVVTLTVTPPILSFTPPADNTYSQTSVETAPSSGIFVCSGGIMRVVNSGAQASFKDSSLQSVQGQQIDISLLSISNIYSGDQVVFWPGGDSQVTLPPYTVTASLITDTDGLSLLPVAIDANVPTVKTGSHVFAVNWQAKTNYTGYGGVIIPFLKYGQTLITTTCD